MSVVIVGTPSCNVDCYKKTEMDERYVKKASGRAGTSRWVITNKPSYSAFPASSGTVFDPAATEGKISRMFDAYIDNTNDPFGAYAVPDGIRFGDERHGIAVSKDGTVSIVAGAGGTTNADYHYQYGDSHLATPVVRSSMFSCDVRTGNPDIDANPHAAFARVRKNMAAGTTIALTNMFREIILLNGGSYDGNPFDFCIYALVGRNHSVVGAPVKADNYLMFVCSEGEDLGDSVNGNGTFTGVGTSGIDFTFTAPAGGCRLFGFLIVYEDFRSLPFLCAHSVGGRTAPRERNIFAVGIGTGTGDNANAIACEDVNSGNPYNHSHLLTNGSDGYGMYGAYLDDYSEEYVRGSSRRGNNKSASKTGLGAQSTTIGADTKIESAVVTLDKGEWVVIGQFVFNTGTSSVTTIRQLGLYCRTRSGSSWGGWTQCNYVREVQPHTNYQRQQLSYVIEIGEPTQFCVGASSNVANWNTSGNSANIVAVKIA